MVVDNSRSQGAPVVNKLNPTFKILIVRIEKKTQMGALLRANGAFLVLNIEEIRERSSA